MKPSGSCINPQDLQVGLRDFALRVKSLFCWDQVFITVGHIISSWFRTVIFFSPQKVCLVSVGSDCKQMERITVNVNKGKSPRILPGCYCAPPFCCFFSRDEGVGFETFYLTPTRPYSVSNTGKIFSFPQGFLNNTGVTDSELRRTQSFGLPTWLVCGSKPPPPTPTRLTKHNLPQSTFLKTYFYASYASWTLTTCQSENKTQSELILQFDHPCKI